MGGKSNWNWWNYDSEDDKALLNIVWIAEKLGRLPEYGEVPNTPQWPYASRCAIYFGSVKASLRKVAELLYGNEELTSAKDLLPQEQALSADEQQRILDERWQAYQSTLDELREPGALRRRRDKQEAERRRRRLEAKTDGKVTRIPTRGWRELRADFAAAGRSMQEFDESRAPLMSTAKMEQHDVERRVAKVREQWSKSWMNPANRPRMADARSVENPEKPKGDAEMAKTVTREDALKALAMVKAELGVFPSQLAWARYAREHKGTVPAWVTLRKVLECDAKEWPALVEAYERSLKSADRASDGASKTEDASTGAADAPDGVEAPTDGVETPTDETPGTSDTPGEPAAEGATPEADAPGPMPDPSASELTSGTDVSASGVETEPKYEVRPEGLATPQPIPKPTAEPAEPDVPEVKPAEPKTAEPDVAETEAASTSGAPVAQKIKLNLLGATLRFCLNGQLYELEVEFGGGQS